MKKRKLTAWILVLAMVLSMFGGVTTTAFAGEEESPGADIVESRLMGIRLYTGSNRPETTFFKDNFNSEVKNYTLSDGYDIDDCVRYSVATLQEGATVTALGGQQISAKDVIVGGIDKLIGTNWIGLNPGKNNFKFIVTPKEGTSSIGTEYTFSRNLLPTLDNLEIFSEKNLVYLDKKFDAKTSQYAITIPNCLSTLDIAATPKGETYKIKYNGEETSSVNIDGKDRIEIEVTVGTSDAAVTNTYAVDFNKVETYNAKIVADSENAVISLYDSQKTPIKSESGIFKNLMKGSLYSYVVSKYGYITSVGTFDGPEDLTEGQINITLLEAPEPITHLPNYTGDWINSRGNAENMGITDARTPFSEKYANLKWAKKYGTGWSAAPTPPIIVNGDIYVGANGKIIKIDKETGEVIAENPITGSLGFSLVTLTYGNGMIFVPVSNGQIQAFRADTLESLWISEKIGGQTNSPITYHDGYIYSGTWNSEEKVGTYFGICVTDEDLTNTKEEKKCSWKLNHKGGFYWAGSYATDKYVVVGSDDGTREGSYTANGVLYSIEPKTGVVIDTIQGIKGDIRSTVSYDKKTDSLYCTTKGGKFIKAKVHENGEFKDEEFKTLELGGMSTGTPLVYEGIAFLGVSGASQFGTEGHNYKVIDTSKMEVIKDIPTQGYVQTSALLSTAYAEQTGKVYVYITYNQNPGGIDILEYDLKTKESSSKPLFIPPAAQSQYCICSLVCDADGTIYYKNDSCYLMAVENTAKDPVTPPVTPPSTGGSSGGGGGGAATPPSSNVNISKPVIENKPVAGANESKSLVSTVTTEVVANLNSSGRAEATVGNGAVSNALNAAVNAAQDAEKKGAKRVTAEVKLEIKTDKNATSVETKLSTSSIGEIAKKQNAVLTLDTPLGTVSFDNTALSMISDNAATGKEISMSLEKISKDEVLKNISTDKQAQINAAIGDRTIVSLRIKVDGNMNIGNFGKGSVKAGISYKLSQGEKAAGLVVFFIDDNGGMTPMPTVYDPASGQVIFDTNHFSYYAIGYDQTKTAKVELKFIDITSGSWFSEPVTYLLDRGIIKGKTETLFAPGDNITRGEFVTILSRMSGDVMPNAAEKFNDVAKDTWYNQPVLWATEKGIAKGITEKEFALNTKISRQDMAVMLQNYAKYKKLTLEKRNVITEFADGDKISNYAKSPVSEMQQTGIINGVSKDGITNFYPRNNATRAEAAKMIYEVIK